MQINRASEAQVTSPHKALRSVFKKYGHMPCKYCGSILDKNGQHTSEWVRTLQTGIDKYRSRMYRVWGAMLERCNNPNQARYSSYGGRGIKVCDEWKDSALSKRSRNSGQLNATAVYQSTELSNMPFRDMT